MREDFTDGVKRVLASRVGWRCSNPGCRSITIGPAADPSRVVNVGVAAHITAASPKGPRYDPGISSQTRRSIENGIWLCETCAKLIDTDERAYRPEVLKYWKTDCEGLALREIGRRAEPSRQLQPIRYSAISVSDQCLWGRAHRLHKASLESGLHPDFGFHEIAQRLWAEAGKFPATCTIDPVLDVTIINDGSVLGTVSAVGIELLTAWTALKGLRVAHKVPVLDVYILDLKKMEPEQSQVLPLPDPVAISPGGIFRYQLWLAKFHDALNGNESLLRLVVEFEGRLYRSRLVYMGVY